MDFLADPLAALGSVTGIVGLTIVIVHILKRQLGNVLFLNQFPVLFYAVLVAGGLTYLSHAVLHTIKGELPALMVQTIFCTVAASGSLEIARSGTKSIGETTVARRARGEIDEVEPVDHERDPQ